MDAATSSSWSIRLLAVAGRPVLHSDVLASFVSGPLLGAILLRLGVVRGIFHHFADRIRRTCRPWRYFEHGASHYNSLASSFLDSVGARVAVSIVDGGNDQCAGREGGNGRIDRRVSLFEFGGVVGIAIMGSMPRTFIHRLSCCHKTSQTRTARGTVLTKRSY